MNSTEQSQTAEPATKAPLVREDLKIRMYRIRATFPKAKVTQQSIAKKLKVDQSSISLAMRNPKRLPKIAKRVEDYFDGIESSQPQSMQAAAAAHA